MTALVAYYRVSTQRQGVSGLGLEAQQTAVREYAARRGEAIGAEFTEVESGRVCSRPQLAAARAAAAGAGARLVVAKLDRLTRDARFLLELADGSVPLVFLDMPDLRMESAADRMMLGILGLFAEFESRRIGERIKASWAARRARAAARNEAPPKKAFGPGHQARACAAWHRINRERAAAFRHAYRPLALGLRQTMTLAEVAAELTARGIATRRNRRWTPGLVHHLLKPDRTTTGGTT